jgi:choline dehydrogenase
MNRREFIATSFATIVRPERSSRPFATIVRQPPTFDYIVVGAGSSGCVVVNRLTADGKTRVLLIEAGGPTSADATVSTPGKWTSLLGSSFDWGYTTEPQAGLNNRVINFPRGKGYGGSSAINALAFIRGHRFCYDRWEALGNKGWGYEALLPLFKRSERNESGPNDFRGGDGPLAVSYCTDPHASHKAFVTAAWQNGFKGDARYDFNGPDPNHTAGYYQKNILNGKRHSAADAFLVPALSRANLTVHSPAQATRLMVETGRCAGLEYLRNGQRETARASREVILCAGVVDTPKLLMLSGIGPADHVKAIGVPVTLDLPGVGKNLQDHLKLSLRWNGTGELPGSTVTAGLFARSNPTLAGTPPDLQFYVGRGLETPDRFITITVSLVRPESRGEIRLRSADPLARPIIQPNYLQEQADVDALVKGARLTRYFGEAESYEPLRGDEIEPGPAAKSDADLAAFVRRASDTIFHPAGTCKMGPEADGMAVVDLQLRVRGIQGLRIADASIMPEVVNTTPHAACVMIGEKISELIKS